jgi:acetyl esterase/lipase
MAYKSKCLTILTLLTFFYLRANSQNNIPLYVDGKVPGAKVTKVLVDTLTYKLEGKVMKYAMQRTLVPSIEVFRPAPDKNTGISVLVCSGGAYLVSADAVEGYPAAKKLAAEGITAFVLHYRLPRSDIMINKEVGPLQDAQRAIQYIKENADTWSIDTAKIGIMGFSAGGHLASTVGTHFNKSYILNSKKTNLRPSFLVLAYPVISFADSVTNLTSREKLIGPNIVKKDVEEFSNELHVSPQTPPTFITQALDDKDVKIDNSLLFISALNKNHVPVNCFFYAKGGHGYGINNKTSNIQWIDASILWMKNLYNHSK